RRLLSISLIAALCWSMALPAWASSCMQGKGAEMCHRTKHAHNCGMMMHHTDEDARSGAGISVVQQHEKCPMNCCMQTSSATARPIPLATSSVPFLLRQAFTDFESQVFTATGFSSHTDRGPPTCSQSL
ncbi:MAG TPA: hypothetical protein VNV88_04405, partial [Candidatus Solibacter sp.]|nr:hypothetical protein [Candidatus Solibacter sp.]